MTQDILKNLDVIKESFAWAEKYGKDSFPYEVFKNYRRKLRRIGDALSENCSVAAYGESQVGKSYLMSSLLSSPSAPFVIMNKGKEYRFVDEINPSGGNNAKIESTGVITRFTTRQSNPGMADYVRVSNLSIVDLVLLLTDSYYNDVKINTESVLMKDEIDAALKQYNESWQNASYHQEYITEDDIKDICEYIDEIIGNNAANVCKSNFCKIVAPIIKNISPDNWVKVFGLLWNNDADLNRLFSTLISEYRKLNFNVEVYVPFDAVLRKNGTLLKIDWLDSVCGIHKEDSNDIPYTDVYDSKGELLAKDFNKAYLSALIAELTFVLPEQITAERKFLKKIDLLDFPGAKSREKFKNSQVGEVLPTMLRRGKVAYLFNKYSRSYKISSVLFCHHADHKTEPTIGDSINSWIQENIGRTPELRANFLANTNGISPLFMVCTKFNIDLERVKVDVKGEDTLDNHWARFNSTIPKIIEPSKWMEDWVKPGGIFTSKYFRSVYLLRDFYWSAKNQVFDGYNEALGTTETSVHVHEDYPEYFDHLRESFLENTFVRKHFSNPKQAWDDVATINNDGSRAIIRSLDSIAGCIDMARRERYNTILQEIRNEIVSRLSVYYEPEDTGEINAKIRQITGDIKLHTEFNFGEDPELFGKMIDRLMVAPSDLRTIAYDILVRHTEEPQIVSAVKMIRALCGIDLNDSREVNVQKLVDRYNKTEDELNQFFSQMGTSVEDVVADDSELLSTVSDVISKHIVDFWNNHINEQVKYMETCIPHADEVAFMIMSLLNKLGVKRRIADKINTYTTLFDTNTLPNAIADFASLTLNNFVSTIGREYMSDDEIRVITEKASNCQLTVDTESSSVTLNSQSQPLLEVLTALDQSREEMNSSCINLNTLNQLPFWSNYQRWENFVTIGLLCASDISHVDPVANAQIKSLIDRESVLYC